MFKDQSYDAINTSRGYALRAPDFDTTCELAARWDGPNDIRYKAIMRTAAQTLDDLTASEYRLLTFYLSVLPEDKINAGGSTTFMGNEAIKIMSGLDVRSIQRINEALERKHYIVRRYSKTNRRCREAGIDFSPFLQRYLEGEFDRAREAKWRAIAERRAALDALAIDTPHKSDAQISAAITGALGSQARVVKSDASEKGATRTSSTDDTNVTLTRPESYSSSECIAESSRLMKKMGANSAPHSAKSDASEAPPKIDRTLPPSVLHNLHEPKNLTELRKLSPILDATILASSNLIEATTTLLNNLEPKNNKMTRALITVFNEIAAVNSTQAYKLLVILLEGERLGDEAVRQPLAWLRYFTRPESASFDCERALAKLRQTSGIASLKVRDATPNKEPLSSEVRDSGDHARAQILERLEACLGAPVVRAWFLHAQFQRKKGSGMQLTLPTKFTRDYVHQHYVDVLGRILGTKEIDIMVGDPETLRRV